MGDLDERLRALASWKGELTISDRGQFWRVQTIAADALGESERLRAALGEIRALSHGEATVTDVEDPDTSDVRLHRFAVKIEDIAIGAVSGR